MKGLCAAPKQYALPAYFVVTPLGPRAACVPVTSVNLLTLTSTNRPKPVESTGSAGSNYPGVLTVLPLALRFPEEELRTISVL